MKKQFLEVGKIVNTHGIKGEMKFQLWCDGIDFLKGLQVLYLDNEGKTPVTLLSARPQKENALICIEGVHTIEEAEYYKNKILYMNREDAEIPEGSHYIQDLIGCKVIDIDSRFCYGTVRDIYNLGASDIYEVETAEGKQVLIPVIPDIVKNINITAGEIEIKKMKGLFEDED